jgi:hypothetical protein
MNSSDIHEISNWCAWQTWIAGSTPPSSGIYVFRLAKGATVQRVKGESDILYIGSSLRNLRSRLRDHHAIRTIESVLLKLIEAHVAPVEVGWAEMSKASAFAIESDLISQSAEDHLEFPPANNQQPARALRTRIFSLLPAHVREGAIEHYANRRLGRK